MGANGQLKLTTKHKLQLAYYLQLQDRIDEAMQVFKAIDISEMQQNENDLACQVPYDYMKAYFDFFADDEGDQTFANARAIVKKYENYPIDYFRNLFKKVREQLEEIDEGQGE